MSASISASVMSSPKRFTSPRKPLGATSSNGSMNSDSAATMEGNDEVADADAVVHGLPCMADNNFSNSYTWHSAGRYKGKEAAIDVSSTGNAVSQHSWKDSNSELITGSAEEEEQSQEQWILGVDEAGRGPALGPQVYGAAFCPATTSDALKAMGFADSKQLSDLQRTKLMQRILDGEMEEKQLCYAVTVMHPQDISAGMLQRANYSLNAQSQDATIQLIREVLNLGYPLTHIFVDPVGPHEMYAAKLSSIFPGIRFTVVPKADALFPVVSAASVVAKVTRDTFMEEWQFSEREANLADLDRTFGSGYPSDPRTQAWLERNYDPVFGYPCIARQSWSTIRLLHEKKGYKAKWSEEESVNSIRSYFQSNRPGEDKERPALLKEMSLSSIAVL